MPKLHLMREQSRSWLSVSTFLCISLSLLLTIKAGTVEGASRYRESRPLMGTLVEVTVGDLPPMRAKEAVDAAFHRMSLLSDSMNHYNPNSLVSRINNNAGRAYTSVTPELYSVLLSARELSRRTAGAFDITVGAVQGWRFDPERSSMPAPEQIKAKLKYVNYRDLLLQPRRHRVKLRRIGMRIDLGGIAKLPILNAGLHVLRAHGVHSAMLNGGGDILVVGGFEGKPWAIGVRNPWQPEDLYALLHIRSGVVLSSGDYERYFTVNGRRYHHILNPRTGYPTSGLNQVTLVSRRSQDVDGLSAAIMVLGPVRGKRFLRRLSAVKGMLWEPSGRVWISPGLQSRLEINAHGPVPSELK